MVAAEQPQVVAKPPAGLRAARARPAAKADEQSAREYVKAIYTQKASAPLPSTPAARKAKPGKAKKATEAKKAPKAKKAMKRTKAKRATKRAKPRKK
jgi:hypothetical protein